ncbi:MAG: hypothetical protein ACTSYB_18165 [Candidatus Helarchaeota archaeon]
MTISEETRLINFIVNVLMKHELLKKAIIEYNIDISGFKNAKPDLFLYLFQDSTFNNYQLIEIKQRTSSSKEDINRIRE